MTIPHLKIRGALRKLWMWSPERRAALKRAKWNGQPGLYRCEVCHLPTFKPQIDHKIAVGKTPGARGAMPSDNWQAFIERMFCDVSGLRVVCTSCHTQITKHGRAG